MNTANLKIVFDQYIEQFDYLNDKGGHDEGYKWRAESCFVEHWDIDAEDFPAMFKAAMHETSNLIDNATVQPINGISMLLKHEDEVEFVRECFRGLFTEDDGDLDARLDRVDAFIEKINEKIDQYAHGSWKYPQKRNDVIYYLNLWRPEDNYIFKATEATDWANCVEYGDDFGSRESFSLAKYYRMCDELLAEYAELKTQASDFDPDELAMAQLEIRPQKEASAESRVQAAYGDKYDFWTMIGAKREVAELLGEEEPRSIRETSYKWGVSERRVNQYVTEGRIPGVERFGRSWAIPADAEKPGDPRRIRKKQTQSLPEEMCDRQKARR